MPSRYRVGDSLSGHPSAAGAEEGAEGRWGWVMGGVGRGVCVGGGCSASVLLNNQLVLKMGIFHVEENNNRRCVCILYSQNSRFKKKWKHLLVHSR